MFSNPFINDWFPCFHIFEIIYYSSEFCVISRGAEYLIVLEGYYFSLNLYLVYSRIYQSHESHTASQKIVTYNTPHKGKRLQKQSWVSILFAGHMKIHRICPLTSIQSIVSAGQHQNQKLTYATSTSTRTGNQPFSRPVEIPIFMVKNKGLLEGVDPLCAVLVSSDFK